MDLSVRSRFLNHLFARANWLLRRRVRAQMASKAISLAHLPFKVTSGTSVFGSSSLRSPRWAPRAPIRTSQATIDGGTCPSHHRSSSPRLVTVGCTCRTGFWIWGAVSELRSRSYLAAVSKLLGSICRSRPCDRHVPSIGHSSSRVMPRSCRLLPTPSTCCWIAAAFITSPQANPSPMSAKRHAL